MSTPTPEGVPSATASDYRQIENLIASYTEFVDGGDFAGLGALLADAGFAIGGEPVAGAEAIEAVFRASVAVYEDGTPKTHHVTSNIAVEVDAAAGTAAARSYFTIFQALPDLPLQAIGAGRYHDRFERKEGRWVFSERIITVTHVGDMSHHFKQVAV